MALQETLSNFFAGLYLLADRPIRAGDFIQLDSGQQGYVLRVGWRSTSIQSLEKNLVVVPNSTLAKAVITNFSHPERQMLLPIEVGVAYGTDPRWVGQVLKEVAEQAVRDQVAGLAPDAAPQIRFMPGFGDSSLNFTLMVEILDFAQQFSVQTELRMRIVERFQKEGIEFPFPTRTLVFDKSTPEMLGMRSQDGRSG
jgi:small-conductance mechanosensitive channel